MILELDIILWIRLSKRKKRKIYRYFEMSFSCFRPFGVWVVTCKTPQAYMPFGLGSCVCVGQHFTMIELKVILSLILSKFCFSLSPAYQHSPTFRLVIVPEHGVTLRVRTTWHFLALKGFGGNKKIKRWEICRLYVLSLCKGTFDAHISCHYSVAIGEVVIVPLVTLFFTDRKYLKQ